MKGQRGRVLADARECWWLSSLSSALSSWQPGPLIPDHPLCKIDLRSAPEGCTGLSITERETYRALRLLACRGPGWAMVLVARRLPSYGAVRVLHAHSHIGVSIDGKAT